MNILSKKFLVLSSLSLTALTCLVYWMLQQGYLRFNYPSRSDFPIWGIDISHHQGAIDWQELKKENIQFAFIKATEGGDFQDKMFNKNWENSKKLGIIAGGYHFFTFCRPVADQLVNIINVIPVDNESLPPVLDLEFGGNCNKIPTPEKIWVDLNFLLTKMANHFGKKPILYVTKEFLEQYPSTTKLSNPIWIRSIFLSPAESLNWKFWQFTNRGRLKGVKTVVDLNIFKGSLRELKELTNQVLHK